MSAASANSQTAGYLRPLASTLPWFPPESAFHACSISSLDTLIGASVRQAVPQCGIAYQRPVAVLAYRPHDPADRRLNLIQS